MKRKYEYANVYFYDYARKKLKIYYGKGKEENFAAINNIGEDQLSMSHVIDALNYMDEQGYELVSTMSDNSEGTTLVLHYIFRREIK